MSRLPELEAANMSSEQRKVYDDILSGPRGKIQGPFNSWLRSPELCSRAQQLGTFCRFNSSLPPRLSELAILIVARHMTCQLEWYIHNSIALDAGIAQDIVDAIKANEEPEIPHEDERALYVAVRELLETHHMSEQVYANALRQLGECGVVELVGIVGYYIFVALTLNGFEVTVPDGAKEPLS